MTIAPPHAMSREPLPPREPGVVRAALRPVVVTGVLVVHDGAAWLKECLDALELQVRPPDRLIIVDTGSTDDSLQIAATHGRIRQVIDDVVTISAPRESTFGEAVGRAVEQLSIGSGSSQAPNTGEPWPGEWLWLLHDDSAAAPEALAHLLDAARRSPSVGVAGPKLISWDDPSPGERTWPGIGSSSRPGPACVRLRLRPTVNVPLTSPSTRPDAVTAAMAVRLRLPDAPRMPCPSLRSGSPWTASVRLRSCSCSSGPEGPGRSSATSGR